MKYLKSKPGSLEASAGQVSGFATEQEYQKLFKKELDKAGKGIASMSDQEKKSFFNKIDKMYKAKNEEVQESASQVQVKRDGKGNFNLMLRGKEIGYYHKSGSKYMVYYDKDGDDYDQSDEVSSEMQAKKLAYDNMNEVKVDELTKAQEKLPPALQKAIKDKEQKEDLDNKDTSIVKAVVGQLKKAVKAHDGQAKDLEKAMKTEADTKGDDINQGKLDMVKKGEKKPVDPEPKIGKSIKEMMKKKKDDVATTADTEKDKEKKATTLVGSKKTPVDTKPEIEYKN